MELRGEPPERPEFGPCQVGRIDDKITCYAKVGEEDASVPAEEDVVRLDVAVDRQIGVDVLQGREDVLKHAVQGARLPRFPVRDLQMVHKRRDCLFAAEGEQKSTDGLVM